MVRIKMIFLLVFIALSIKTFSQEAPQEKKIVEGLSSSKYTEFSPTISADGRTIIFESSTDEEKGWELFESQLDDKGTWSTPVPLKSINEKCNFLAGPSISYDGNILFYTAFIEGVSKTEDIYYSTRTGDNLWSEPIHIGAPINTDSLYEGFPSISSDGNTLYFIRVNQENDFDRKSKEACFQIYSSKRTSDGKWGEPVLLPPSINQGCERDPRIMADNHTLIFSSIREGSVGKYDMYQTLKQSDGTWSEPMALDFINSQENDQSPCISASGDKMFFYSKKDIYSIPIPEKFRQMINSVIQGRVLEDKKLKPILVSINVKNLNTGEIFTAKNNEIDGEYSLVLNAGSKYVAIFDNDNFLPDTLMVDLESQKNFQLQRKNIVLRSSYSVAIDVIDKDLKKRLDVWLNVGRAEKEIFKDSIQFTKLPLSLTFEAPYDYSINLSKDKYVNNNFIWNYKSNRNTIKKSVVTTIEHTKAPFVANVVVAGSKQKVKVKVNCYNKDEDELLVADAGATIMLRRGDRYQVITGSEEGYFFSSMEVTGGEKDSVEMSVIHIEMNALLTLNNITFEINSAELKKNSKFELDRIVELMKSNPKLTIEISAHTDDVGEENSNLKLSDKRALSAWTYLKDKGVNSERLVPKGYGETKPMVANDSDANRAQNRRVELRVLKIS
jgi:outer membrane protein OmpA-like peptidoglycan-associated protein